jgi:hypothetical protein
MSASRQKDEPARKAVRKAQWLPALEQELKSRVGWVDEAVSPFAGTQRTGQAPAKIRRDMIPPDKAA